MVAISADSHVVEGPEVFTGLADKFGDEAPRVITKEGAGDYIIIPANGDAGTNIGTMALAGARLDRDTPIDRRKGHKPDAGTLNDPEIQAYLTGGYKAMRPGLTDGARRGEDQDIDGLQAEFLYPGYFSMFKIPNTELLIALQKNYNDWLKDFCDNSKNRLYGLAVLPMQHPETALKELKRVIKMGYKGVVIPSNAPEGTRYFDEQYEPIWALAEEAGIPISMHVGCFSHIPTWVLHAMGRDMIFGYGNTAALIQETLVDLMVRGVCKRHPGLKFVVSEFSAGWIAYWLERVDQAWQREYGKDPNSCPKYEPIISDIWHSQFYVTIEDDQAALATRHLIGEDRIMWGSDYPHTDSTWPCSQQVLGEMFEAYSDEARQKITYDNVKTLYGI